MLERNGAGVSNVPPPRRGRLFRKYVVIFVVLVSGALLASGVVEAYFVYEENQAAVIRLQRERAVAAASTIEQFLGETERQLGWVVLPPSTGEPSGWVLFVDQPLDEAFASVRASLQRTGLLLLLGLIPAILASVVLVRRML